ncbi:hypothetical protein ERJ75_000380700 [Trypanosoma vivax]|nr:hypothetical protein TRVL_03759 [Trypanosoma vivax]KAH8617383.1 hypothetical protein ERJ75_000380700 [Trypanosoma vivax]
MSQRAQRPLRLLQLQSSRSAECKPVANRPPSLVAAYKPCGLPYFAVSQLSACNGGGEKDSYGSMRLFSATHRHVPAVSSDDASDSLLSRLTDLLPPGAGKPLVALPLIHPALVQFSTPQEINALTAHRKGTTLVAASLYEFMFLRNVHRLGLVRFVYRVLCRVPSCVALRARQTLLKEKVEHHTTKSTFKNPYLIQYIQGGAATGSGSRQSLTGGIHLGGPLPHCALPHPFLQGGFYSIKDCTLLHSGTVSGFMSSVHMVPGVHQVLHKRERLQTLFLTPVAERTTTVPRQDCGASDALAPGVNLCSICEHSSTRSAVTHPWIKERCRLRLSLDVGSSCRGAVATELCSVAEEADEPLSCTLQQNATNGRGGMSRLVGKPFRFDFRLVSLNEACDLALYEVSTNDASDEEIKTAFAAANLVVVNDYVNDSALAGAMQTVASELHRLPQTKVAGLPAALRHALHEGSAEDLVARSLIVPTSSCRRSVGGAHHSLAEQQESCKSGNRQSVYYYPLVLETLQRLCDRDTYSRVIQLSLGSGLECAAVHFPEPMLESNASAVQHLLLRAEDHNLPEEQRRAVADTMEYCSFGVAHDCHTFQAMLFPHNERGGTIDGDVSLDFPPQQQLTAIWNGESPPITRVEELGDIVCMFCGEVNHAWNTCPAGTPLICTSESSEETSNRIADNANMRNTEGAQTALGEALLTTVADVRNALELTDGFEDAGIISIVTPTPTQSFNVHAWQRNAKRPPLHRGRMRCAYCSGRHHITQCSKLSRGEGANSESCDYSQLSPSEKANLRSNASSLFCIKCGERGHIVNHCPLIPSNLHPSMNCPICLMPRRKTIHSPTQCPRRVSPPDNYSPNGIPLNLLQRSMGKMSGKSSSNKPAIARRQGGGSGVLLADSFLSQRARE